MSLENKKVHCWELKGVKSWKTYIQQIYREKVKRWGRGAMESIR
jgi:hypothetical protein